MHKQGDPEEILALFKAMIPRVRYEDGRLYWVKARSHMIGKLAGSLDKSGYWRIYVAGFGLTSMHRVIFVIHHGWLPQYVDHIDGDTQNNRIENLRPANHFENARNTKMFSTNTSGHRGVWFRHGKWAARIRADGKQISLGAYEKLEDAIAARKQGEEKYHGEFVRR